MSGESHVGSVGGSDPHAQEKECTGESFTELLVAISEESQEIELDLFNLSLLWRLWKMEPLPFYIHFTVITHKT